MRAWGPRTWATSPGDAFDDAARFVLIAAVIVLEAGVRSALDEGRLLGVHFMMLLRSLRDVIRYDVLGYFRYRLRWVIHEKIQLMRRQRVRR